MTLRQVRPFTFVILLKTLLPKLCITENFSETHGFLKIIFKTSLTKVKNHVRFGTDRTLFNRQMYGADPLEDKQCRECPYLPLCLGGCPIQRVQNKFYGAHNNHCTYYKGHIHEFIAEHIRKKEAGVKNLYK